MRRAGVGRGVFASFVADVMRPPERMHIKIADARRRFGETSWQAYREEAAAATGDWVKLTGRAFGRRDDVYRLNKLVGTWLGDVRQWLMPRGLETLETELWAWRSGLIRVEQFKAKLRRICEEDAWPSEFETALGRFGGVSRRAGPEDSREFFEKHSKARRDRLAMYERKGIPGLLSGYPFIELWLEELRRQKRQRGSHELHPALEDLLEDLSKEAYNKFARSTGLIPELPPGF